jgi:hypothetical protein
MLDRVKVPVKRAIRKVVQYSTKKKSGLASDAVVMTCSVIAQGRAIHCCLQELVYQFINVLHHDVLVRVWNEFGRSVDTTTANVSFANLCIILVNYSLCIYGYPYGNGPRFPFAALLAAFALLGMLEGVRASAVNGP